MPGTLTHEDAVAPPPRWPWTRLACVVRARWFHARLDAELAAGRSPWTSPALRERAAIIASVEHRRQVALSLLGLVRVAELGRSEAGYLHIRHRAVLAEREALRRLAARLHADVPVPVAAAAQLAVLVGDASSPIYAGGRPVEELAEVLRACEAALGLPA